MATKFTDLTQRPSGDIQDSDQLAIQPTGDVAPQRARITDLATRIARAFTFDIDGLPVGGPLRPDDDVAIEREGALAKISGSAIAGISLGIAPNTFGTTAFDGRNAPPTAQAAPTRQIALAVRDAWTGRYQGGGIHDTLNGGDWIFSTSGTDTDASIDLHNAFAPGADTPWGSGDAWVMLAGTAVTFGRPEVTRHTAADVTLNWNAAHSRITADVSFSDGDGKTWASSEVVTDLKIPAHDWLTYYASDIEHLIALLYLDFGTTPSFDTLNGWPYDLLDYSGHSWALTNDSTAPAVPGEWRMLGQSSLTFQELRALAGRPTDTLRISTLATRTTLFTAGDIVALVWGASNWVVLRIDSIDSTATYTPSGSAELRIHRCVVRYLQANTTRAESSTYTDDTHRQIARIGVVSDHLTAELQAFTGVVWVQLGIAAGVSTDIIDGRITSKLTDYQRELPSLADDQVWVGQSDGSVAAEAKSAGGGAATPETVGPTLIRSGGALDVIDSIADFQGWRQRGGSPSSSAVNINAGALAATVVTLETEVTQLAVQQVLDLRAHAVVSVASTNGSNGSLELQYYTGSSWSTIETTLFTLAAGDSETVHVSADVPGAASRLRIRINNLGSNVVRRNSYAWTYGVDLIDPPRSWIDLDDTPSSYPASGELIASSGTGLRGQPQSAGLSAGGIAVYQDPYAWSLHDDHTAPHGGWASNAGNLYIPQSGTNEIYVYSEFGVVLQIITCHGGVSDIRDCWSDHSTLWVAETDQVKAYNFPSIADAAVSPQPVTSKDHTSIAGFTNIQGIAGDSSLLYIMDSRTPTSRVNLYRFSDNQYERCFNALNMADPHDAYIHSLDYYTLNGSTVRVINTSVLTNQKDLFTAVDATGTTLVDVVGMARDYGTWRLWAKDNTGKFRCYAYDVETGNLLKAGELRPASTAHEGVTRYTTPDELLQLTSNARSITPFAMNRLVMSSSQSGLAKVASAENIMSSNRHDLLALTPVEYRKMFDLQIGPWLDDVSLGRDDAIPGGIMRRVGPYWGGGLSTTRPLAIAVAGDKVVCITVDNHMYNFDMITGKIGSHIGATGRLNLTGLAYAPYLEELYAVEASTRRLIVLDTTTGAGTYISASSTDKVFTDAAHQSSWGNDWCTGMFWHGGSGGQMYLATRAELYIVNTNTGLSTIVTPARNPSWGLVTNNPPRLVGKGDGHVWIFDQTGSSTTWDVRRITHANKTTVDNTVQHGTIGIGIIEPGTQHASDFRRGSGFNWRNRMYALDFSDGSLWKFGVRSA